MKQFEFLQQIGSVRSYSAGQIVFSEGDSGDELFVVLEGQIAITLQDRPINELREGDIFGEMALVDDEPRSASAIAVTDCRLAPISRQVFLRLVQEEPKIATYVMSVMSDRLRRSMKDELERQRLEEELRIGHRIQHSLLPQKCPEFPGWEFAAIYQSAREVGGDFYDFIHPPEDPSCLHIVIADVTGKGVPAAIFMASCRAAMRAESISSLRPAEALRKMNRLISSDTKSPLFLGAFYATLETDTGRLTFANGGHEWPLLLHDDTATEFLSTRGLVLGAFPEIILEEREIIISPGDSLILFTDGLTEARNPNDQFFGEERLVEAVSKNAWSDANQLLQKIVNAVETFRDQEPPFDDLTLVIVRRK